MLRGVSLSHTDTLSRSLTPTLSLSHTHTPLPQRAGGRRRSGARLARAGSAARRGGACGAPAGGGGTPRRRAVPGPHLGTSYRERVSVLNFLAMKFTIYYYE